MTAPESCPRAPGREGPSIPCSIEAVKTGAELIGYLAQCSRCGWIDPVDLDRKAEAAHAKLMDGMSQRIAMASGMYPFAFVEQTGSTLTLIEGISQAMAAAAMAWESPGSAGRYDAARARQIGQELHRLIDEKMVERDAPSH